MANNNATDVFYVDADNVKIMGLSIKGANIDRAGIYLSRSNNCTIENNKLVDDALGIYLKDSMYNNVLNNTVSEGKKSNKY